MVSLPPTAAGGKRASVSSGGRAAVRGFRCPPPPPSRRPEPRVAAADGAEHVAHHLHEHVWQQPRLGARLQPLGTRLAERAPAGPGHHQQLRVSGQHQHAVQPRYRPARPHHPPAGVQAAAPGTEPGGAGQVGGGLGGCPWRLQGRLWGGVACAPLGGQSGAPMGGEPAWPECRSGKQAGPAEGPGGAP